MTACTCICAWKRTSRRKIKVSMNFLFGPSQLLHIEHPKMKVETLSTRFSIEKRAGAWTNLRVDDSTSTESRWTWYISSLAFYLLTCAETFSHSFSSCFFGFHHFQIQMKKIKNVFHICNKSNWSLNRITFFHEIHFHKIGSVESHAIIS